MSNCKYIVVCASRGEAVHRCIEVGRIRFSIGDQRRRVGNETIVVDGWIVAHAPIDYAPTALAGNSQGKWRIAVAFPEKFLFFVVFNLYFLYAALLAALVVTAVSGYALSRRLLRPLEDLSSETDTIASGDFFRRVTVTGKDEIAALGSTGCIASRMPRRCCARRSQAVLTSLLRPTDD